ncbi:interferon a3-like [Perca flavescens]|uniref:interferon a3-like n=1 Tax=Perca flavescens TaxID=8167 RepID=UPI00106DEB32|nr:interferon a3-like [Perca flavescens]
MLENKVSKSSALLTILIITFFFMMQNLSGVLIFLLATMTPVLCCDWFRHYGHLSNKSMTLLRLMGTEFSNNSQPYFPYKFYSHIKNNTVESQLVFIRDSLELIEGLYLHNDLSSVAWDTDRTDRFLMTLERQREGISSCLSTERRADSRLRKYYRGLEKRLHTGGSSASWEMIRKVTDQHLHQLNLLVNGMKKH